MPSHPVTMRTTRSDRTMSGWTASKCVSIGTGPEHQLSQSTMWNALVFPMLNLDATRLAYCFYISIGIVFCNFVTDTTLWWQDKPASESDINYVTKQFQHRHIPRIPGLLFPSSLCSPFLRSMRGLSVIYLLRDVFWIGLRSENGKREDLRCKY